MNTTAAQLTTPSAVSRPGSDATRVPEALTVPATVRRPTSIVRRLVRRIRGIGAGPVVHDPTAPQPRQVRADLQTRFHVH